MAATPWKTVTVRPGDTLWGLAVANHTSIAALVEKNRLALGGSVIHAGQKLLVPGRPSATPSRGAAAKPGTSRPAATGGTGAVIHVVRAGESMSVIAQRYGVSLTKLLAANKLANASLIYVGQRITVPGATSTTPATPAKPSKPGTKPGTTKPGAADSVYVVKAGDSMSVIAQRFGVSLTKLLAANKLANASRIYVGQKIVIPGTASAPKPTTPTTPTTPPGGYTYPSKTAQAVAESKAKLAAMTVPNRTETAALIRATATRNGVDPKLALAIGYLESGWSQRAVSYTNAVGVMQLMPVAETWASQLAGRDLDRFDVKDNVTGGVLILRALQAMADSREQAIAGYYQGIYSVRTKGMYADTKRYVANVLAIYDRM
ncbi:LysM peptidoglycan-binding domain-containing protein [Terrabacter sp. NPDC000476]|uniref:LysM peptidoglycan-binding domain-containing protein n=1 Tax=Terrabacter sp. NPDC000476 TaxID=3154258 RepID=UPI003316CFE9